MDELLRTSRPDEDLDVRCPTCGALMAFTGLPDISGPVHFRFYRCPSHGVVRVDFDEDKRGWG